MEPLRNSEFESGVASAEILAIELDKKLEFTSVRVSHKKLIFN